MPNINYDYSSALIEAYTDENLLTEASTTSGSSSGSGLSIRGQYEYYGIIHGYAVYSPLDYIASMDLGVNTGWSPCGRSWGGANNPNFKPDPSEAKSNFKSSEHAGNKLLYLLNASNYYGEYMIKIYPNNTNTIYEFNKMKKIRWKSAELKRRQIDSKTTEYYLKYDKNFMSTSEIDDGYAERLIEITDNNDKSIYSGFVSEAPNMFKKVYLSVINQNLYAQNNIKRINDQSIICKCSCINGLDVTSNGSIIGCDPSYSDFVATKNHRFLNWDECVHFFELKTREYDEYTKIDNFSLIKPLYSLTKLTIDTTDKQTIDLASRAYPNLQEIYDDNGTLLWNKNSGYAEKDISKNVSTNSTWYYINMKHVGGSFRCVALSDGEKNGRKKVVIGGAEYTKDVYPANSSEEKMLGITKMYKVLLFNDLIKAKDFANAIMVAAGKRAAGLAYTVDEFSTSKGKNYNFLKNNIDLNNMVKVDTIYGEAYVDPRGLKTWKALIDDYTREFYKIKSKLDSTIKDLIRVITNKLHTTFDATIAGFTYSTPWGTETKEKYESSITRDSATIQICFISDKILNRLIDKNEFIKLSNDLGMYNIFHERLIEYVNKTILSDLLIKRQLDDLLKYYWDKYDTDIRWFMQSSIATPNNIDDPSAFGYTLHFRRTLK